MAVWAGALALCAAGMLANESGVVIGVVLLLYCWLNSEVGRPPAWFGVGLTMITAGYLALWRAVGGVAVADVAAPFIGATAGHASLWRSPPSGARLRMLVWPSDLSADYNPQVIPVPAGITVAAFAGVAVIALVTVIAWRCRRAAPQLAWAAGAAALAYLPTSNLLFASGVVLGERNLYVAAALPAVLVGVAGGRVRRNCLRRSGLPPPGRCICIPPWQSCWYRTS